MRIKFPHLRFLTHRSLRRLFSVASAPKILKQALTPYEVQFYQNNGYLVVEDGFNPAYMDELKEVLFGLIDKVDFKTLSTVFNEETVSFSKYFQESAENISFFLETNVLNSKGELIVDKRQAFNKIGHCLHDINPEFEKFSYNPFFKETLRQLGYQQPMIVQSMAIMKPAKVGGELDVHTDNTYIITNPLTCMAIWVALEDATVKNGCMWGVPGSHKVPTTKFFLHCANGENIYSEGEIKKDLSHEKAIPIEAKKGSIVLLHGDFVHLSRSNSSEKSRTAYTVHVVESRGASWVKENWLQRSKFPFRKMFDVCI